MREKLYTINDLSGKCNTATAEIEIKFICGCMFPFTGKSCLARSEREEKRNRTFKSLHLKIDFQILNSEFKQLLILNVIPFLRFGHPFFLNPFRFFKWIDLGTNNEIQLEFTKNDLIKFFLLTFLVCFVRLGIFPI